jgi:choline-glycine betaine transporter
MASNGRTDTPRGQRVLWVLLIGLVSTALLVLGGDAGLKGVQSVTIVMALPYLGLMVVLLTGLLIALWQDRAAR